MKRYRTRFYRPLYPGKTVTTQIWKLSDTEAVFKTINPETEEVVIDNGAVEWISSEAAAKRTGGIRFDDRVAIVTGAGAGLGKTYALELAARGAKVLVNDLGGAADGSGKSAKAADEVVAEIKAAGGEAIASYDSVATPEGGEAIVGSALRAFGRVDILVNNAGILRDRSLIKMEPASWEAVMSVHLDGAYNVTRPALKTMRKQKYGRIVLTASAAGLYGNFGQTNYAAAKLALVGFMNTLRLEGAKHNIKVNTVAPIATTRLTESLLPPDMLEKLKPEQVTPLTVYLCTEQCPVSGGIYDAGMGFFDRAAIFTGPGAAIGDGETPPSPEAVAAKMAQIKSMKGAVRFDSATDSFGPMFDAFKPKETTSDEGGSVSEIMSRMPDAFQADKAAGVDVVFQYSISGSGGGEWNATIKDGTCTVADGQHASPTTTIKMAAEDFLAMMSGSLNPMQAYTSGKLKIEGDLMKSQLIEKLFSF